MPTQADFNFYVVQVAIIVFLTWWFFAPIKKWALARYRIAYATYSKVVDRRKKLETQKELTPEDEGEVTDVMEVKIAKSHEQVAGQSARQRKGKSAKLQELSAAKLLEAVVSSDSDASSEEAEAEAGHHDHNAQDEGHNGSTHERKTSLLSRSSEVSIMHDLRPGKVDGSALDAVSLLALELFECDLWEIVSKKNRLKVSSCLRWTGSDWKAIGVALYRVQQHVLQVVYVGVLPEFRRQHVGRALVKSVKEAARKDLNCSSALAVVQKQLAEAVMFFRAAGFKKEELKGGDGGKVFLRMEMKRHTKRKSEGSGSSSQGGLSLLLWEDVLSQAKYSPKRHGKENKAEEDKSERFLTNEHGQPECEHNMEEVTLPVPGQDRESVPEPAEVMNEGNIGAKADGDSSPEILFSQPEAAQDESNGKTEPMSPVQTENVIKAAAKVVATANVTALPHVLDLQESKPALGAKVKNSLKGARRSAKPPDWMPTLRPK